MTNVLRALGLISVALASSHAGADEPGDTVTRTADGKLTVASVVMAPDSCYSAGPVTTSSPPDAVSVDDAILITQTLKHSGDQMCMMMLKAVEFSTTTAVPDGAQAIVIYSVNEKTKTVTARALAIPTK